MNIRNKNKGVTIIEILIAIALVSMIILSLYSALGSAMTGVNEAKIRLAAVAIANEKLEILRSLNYDSVGTIGGIVEGPIPQEESVERNGRSFNVHTEVRYVDDSFDGVFPDDIISTDYKKAQVTVSWNNEGETVDLSSIFVPNGMETDVGGGILSVNVIDSAGNPVGEVTVNLTDLDDDPDISVNSYTDDLGNLILPGVPSQNYRITISKNGYEESMTYPNPPQSAFTPLISDLFLVEKKLNSKFFVIDEHADLDLIAVNITDGSLISGIEFEIKGGKKIGKDPDTYVVETTQTTDENGEISFYDISPGEYEIQNLNEISNEEYLYLGATDEDIFVLNPAEEKDVLFPFADRDVNSAVFTVVDDSEEGNRLDGVTVNLTGSDFDESVITGSDGIAFFPVSAENMGTGDYNYTITKEGYNEMNGMISIDNGLYLQDIVLMSQ